VRFGQVCGPGSKDITGFYDSGEQHRNVPSGGTLGKKGTRKGRKGSAREREGIMWPITAKGKLVPVKGGNPLIGNSVLSGGGNLLNGGRSRELRRENYTSMFSMGGRIA